MTNWEYVQIKLKAWNVDCSQALPVFTARGVNPDSEYDNGADVQNVLLDLVEESCLAPYLKNVNENGFSVSWDYSNVGRYYLWLCKRLGRTPDNDVLAALGISSITDKSDIW